VKLILVNNLKIAKLEVESGEKKTGYIDVADVPQGYQIRYPLMVMNGVKDGPIIGMIAGVHAMEYCGIETVMRLFNNLDPKDLSGAIVAIPLVNIPAFQKRVAYVNPLDNINGFGLGNEGIGPGTISHIMGEVLFKEVISKVDVLINFHGGDSVEENLNFPIINETGDKSIDKTSMDIAKCYNSDYMWVYRGDISWKKNIKGEWESEDKTRKEGGLHKRTFPRGGIPIVVPEAGGSGKVDEASVKFLYDGTLNVLKYLKVIEGAPTQGNPKIYYTQNRIQVSNAGFFLSKKKIGDLVSKGEVIGKVRNLFGEVIEEVESPVNGVFNFHMFHASVMPGNVVMIIGELD
jgi:predicted deacylase